MILQDIHLTVVAAGRNDSYGGDFLGRFQIFVHQLVEQLAEFERSFELVVVEWNPLPTKAPLIDQVATLTRPRNVTIRFIEVPSAVHETFENADRIALFEYIAKNVGIRRANGKFILATNPDLLFSDELMHFVCGDSLREDGFYRADRYDFDGRVAIRNPVHENLRIAQTTTVGRQFVYRPKVERRARILTGRPIFCHASGDFWLAHRSVWKHLRGYRELTTSAHMDAIHCLEAASHGFEQYVLPAEMKVFHQHHSRADREHRPATNFNRWRVVCEEDDRRTDRSKWGLVELDLNERVLSPSSE